MPEPVGPAETTVESAQVEAYLRTHPDFLAHHPDLYTVLDPPARVHGAAVADHMAAMISAERKRAHDMVAQSEHVLAASRAATGLTARVQEAVLALMASSNPLNCITHEFPSLLAVDAATLCTEAVNTNQAGFAEQFGLRLLPLGLLATLLRSGNVAWGAPEQMTALLHGEATLLARHTALIRVPVPNAAILLALACRDKAMLDPSQGSASLAFLGRAVAAVWPR